MYWYRFTSYPPGARPPMPAGNPLMGDAGTAAMIYPLKSLTHPTTLTKTVHPSLHPHQPYTVDVYHSCRRAGPRLFPLLVIGGLGIWSFDKIHKLREENYDLRDRIRSDDKASIATIASAPIAMSIDEGKDANNKATSSREEWRKFGEVGGTVDPETRKRLRS